MMARLAAATLLAAALALGVGAASAPPAHAEEAARAKATAARTRVVTFVDGYAQPVLPTPYPFDGKLAGDGILGTGIMDTNVLRAFGVVAK